MAVQAGGEEAGGGGNPVAAAVGNESLKANMEPSAPEKTKHQKALQTPLLFWKAFNSTILLAFATSLLYLQGFQWRNGYLDAFGIDNAFFRYSVDRLLVEGFTSIIKQVIEAAGPAVKALGIVLFVAIGLALVTRIRYVKKNIIPIVWSNEEQEQTFGDYVFNLLMYLILAATVLMVLLISLGVSYRMGHEVGMAGKKGYDTKLVARLSDPKILEIHYEQLGTEVVSNGYLVEASDDIFAFYEFGRTLILPREKLQRLQSALKK